MSYHFQTLSSYTTDSEPAAMISFPQRKYLINVPEGAQRITTQIMTGLKGLKVVFLTSLDADVVGGLPGMLFTIADRGEKDVVLIGPPNLAYFIATMRPYFSRPDVNLTIIETTSNRNPIYTDDLITAFAIPVNRPERAPESSSRSPPSSPIPIPESNELVVESDIRSVPNPDFGSEFLPTSPLPSSSKRKRSHSRSLSPERASKSASHPDLDPSSAEGLMYAYNARRLILKRMFPSTTLPPAPDSLSPLELVKLPPLETNVHWAQMPGVPRNKTHVSYIVLGPSKRGKLDVVMADKLGVLVLQRKELIEQGSVEVNGRRVTREQCMSPETRSSATLIIDCPTEEYIDELVENGAWVRYQAPHPDDGIWPVHVMWHKSGTWVDSPKYQEWMRKFGPHVVHFTGDPSILGDHLNYFSAASAGAALTLLDTEVYKRHAFTVPPTVQTLPYNHFPMIPGQTTSVSPRDLPSNTKLPSTDTQQMLTLPASELEQHWSKENPEFVKEVLQAREEIWMEQIEPRVESPGDDLVVSPLGTGSSLPSKYRNVSSTHIHVPNRGGILLDAGEGTLGQLFRLFGEETGKVMADVKMIFISHLHADHHLGLAKILRFRAQMMPSPARLTIVCPGRIKTQLKELQCLQELGISKVDFIENFSLLPEKKAFTKKTYAQRTTLEDGLGLSQISTVQVDHSGPNCFGLVITHKDGWKIAYSGDTKPCSAFAKAGEGATLLIHEATICDDEPEEVERIMKIRKLARDNFLPVPVDKIWAEVAKKKGHSTFSQAINIGREMKAQNILLTHFSQRYPKDIKLVVPPSREDSSEAEKAFTKSQTIALAVDLISIPIKSMWKLDHYNKAISALYADVEVDADPSIDGGEVASDPKAKKIKVAHPSVGKPKKQKSAKALRKEREVEEVKKAAAAVVVVDAPGSPKAAETSNVEAPGKA